MAKDKFLRFQQQRKEYLGRFYHQGFDYNYEAIDVSEEDLILKELLDNIDHNLFYENKLLMFRFKKRFKNFKPQYKKIIT